jgi:surfactin synthase thioesterase subunit
LNEDKERESSHSFYICHNEERERVRSFVYEALMRLACREDVDSIVLNTHSNGAVVAFDVLRYLPQEVTTKIKAFVTAGSPLRKYVDLVHWACQCETGEKIRRTI